MGNARLGLFVAAAFAGCLLDFGNEQSGGFHLKGKSRTGKTTAAFMAGSVWGKGARGGFVRQWHTTSTSLESWAALANDGVLVLDEISQVDARAAADDIYMLANGAGKGRGKQDGGAREVKTWSVLFLSTGEVSLNSRVAEVGRRATTGSEIRMIDVNAKGAFGVFDTLHGMADGDALTRCLQASCASCYGTPGRAFVAKLTAYYRAEPQGLANGVRDLRKRFIDTYAPRDCGGQVRSAAGRFGVVAAAGEMAVAFGILPWPVGEAEAACAKCFQVWLHERGTPGDGEDEIAARQVRAFIEAHGASRFITILSKKDDVREIENHEFHINNCAGWRRRVENSEWQYLILTEVWANELCMGIDPRDAAKVLADRGLLERGEGNNMTKKCRVPDHKTPLRLYVVSGKILDTDEAEEAGAEPPAGRIVDGDCTEVCEAQDEARAAAVECVDFSTASAPLPKPYKDMTRDEQRAELKRLLAESAAKKAAGAPPADTKPGPKIHDLVRQQRNRAELL